MNEVILLARILFVFPGSPMEPMHCHGQNRVFSKFMASQNRTSEETPGNEGGGGIISLQTNPMTAVSF